jgi:hypothetical protein
MRAVLVAMIILAGMSAAHADLPISKQCNATVDAQSKNVLEDLVKQLSGCKSGNLMLASITNSDGPGMIQQGAAAILCDYHSTILATKDGPLAFVTCIKR